MRMYQALISRPENLERIRQAQRAIERVGGKIIISSPMQGGLVAVSLTLPGGYSPDDFVPGLPFYPY